MNDAARPAGDEPGRDGEDPHDRQGAAVPEDEAAPSSSPPTSTETTKPPAASKARAPTPPPGPTRFERVRTWIRDHYMHVDPRTAGLFRLVLGFLLVADTLRHWGEARLLYTNQSVISNDFHLWRPSSNFQWSFFHAFSTLNEVHVLFALGVVSHLLLFVGYRARLFAVTSFIFMTSLDQRIPLVENGGYVVVNLACLWACFLPVGQRFSIDAWRRSWRTRREKSADELNDRTDFTGERKPLVSLIGVIVIFNLTQVYFWNVVNKAGWIWREGYTLHYVLYLNRMLTGFGLLFRYIPEPMMRVLDWTTLSVESMICVLIASPAARRYTRPMAQIAMILIHGTFGTVFRLGPFSWFLIGCSTLLWTPYQFADLERWYLRRAPRLEIALAEGSALGLALGRVLMRLDGYERLAFVEAPIDRAVGVRPAGDDQAFITDPARLVPLVARALPLGALLYPVIRWVTLGAPVRLLARLEDRAEGVTRFFGLPAPHAEVPADPPPPSWDETPIGEGSGRYWRARKLFALAMVPLAIATGVAHVLPDSFRAKQIVTRWDNDWPASTTTIVVFGVVVALLMLFWPKERARPLFVRSRLAMRAFRARELFLAYYAIASLSQTWNENKGIPPQIKYAQPAFIQMLINYPRLFQGWGMFAPNPIQEDGVLVVDGYTIDGRHVDPYNGGVPDLDLTDANGLGISQLRQDYGNRIRLDGNSLYRDELRLYLMRWHEETGNPNDELVAFDVYWVRDRCPPIGQKKPIDNDPVPIVSWRKPGYRRPSGMMPIPRPPQIRSAEQWTPKVPENMPKLPVLKN